MAEQQFTAKEASTKRPSGPEIIAELKVYFAASGGDRRFAEAVNAIQEHASTRRRRTWKRHVPGPSANGCSYAAVARRQQSA